MRFEFSCRNWLRSSAAAACLLALGASLTAADPVWLNKRPAEWTEDDAKQILDGSPWSMAIAAVVTGRLSEDQLRDGGEMGQPRGVGNDGIDPKGSGPKVSLDALTGRGGDGRSARSLPRGLPLRLRWESALPVRMAEMKAHIDAPLLEGGYCIAVYGIPGPNLTGDPKRMGKPLMSLAALKREGKKDVRPSSAEALQLADGAAVVYLFPPSAEIMEKDGRVRFEAQIGRIVFAHVFELSDMKFMGKLEL